LDATDSKQKRGEAPFLTAYPMTWFPVSGSIPYATHYFNLTASFREFLTQFPVSTGETAGVYHFGLECPSGKLFGFLAILENQDSNRETARVLRFALKMETSNQAENFPPRSSPKLGYSVKTCSISVSCAKKQTSFVNA
jgi:hypothetical protein